MNELTAFNFGGFELKVLGDKNEPWFLLREVCEVLGLKNPRQVAKRLDEDEKGVHFLDTLGGKQEVIVINESGLYTVILRSNLPEAKPFRRFVTHEVLPSIRRYGYYRTPRKFTLGNGEVLTQNEIMSKLDMIGDGMENLYPYSFDELNYLVYDMLEAIVSTLPVTQVEMVRNENGIYFSSEFRQKLPELYYEYMYGGSEENPGIIFAWNKDNTDIIVYDVVAETVKTLGRFLNKNRNAIEWQAVCVG